MYVYIRHVQFLFFLKWEVFFKWTLKMYIVWMKTYVSSVIQLKCISYCFFHWYKIYFLEKSNFYYFSLALSSWYNFNWFFKHYKLFLFFLKIFNFTLEIYLFKILFFKFFFHLKGISHLFDFLFIIILYNKKL